MINNYMFIKIGVNQFDGTCSDYFFVEVENEDVKPVVSNTLYDLWNVKSENCEDFSDIIDELVDAVKEIPGVVRVRYGFPGTTVDLY